jgi:putative inorganic carbon (hco3(-)) transporter
MVDGRRALVGVTTGQPAGAVHDRTWLYFIFSLGLWAFLPEVRRLIDWRIGFSPIPLTAVIPLLSLVPFAVMTFRRWDRIPPAMRVITWAWLGGFVYALAVGILAADGASAAYTFAEFVLPLFVGVWASSSEMRPGDALSVVTTASLGIAAISSAYGLFQYVGPPPWDAYWMRMVGDVLGGKPVPFEVRVFGTLNSAGPFANFVTAALLLSLSRRRFTAFTVLQILICLVALALSLVRSAWIMLLIGAIVYAVVGPRPIRILRGIAVLCVLAAATGTVLPAIIGSQRVNDVIVGRAATLGNLQRDKSANERAWQIEEAQRNLEEQPLGRGLGVVGTATKLSTFSHETTILDSGYLSRLIEMGFPGFAGYLLAVLTAIVIAFFVPRSLDADTRSVCAACAALQSALVFLDFGGESRLGFMGVFCWTATGLALGALHRARGPLDRRLAERIRRAIAATPLVQTR